MCPRGPHLRGLWNDFPRWAGPVPSPKARPPASFPLLQISSCSQETLLTRGQTNLLTPGPRGVLSCPGSQPPINDFPPGPLGRGGRVTQGQQGYPGAIPRMWGQSILASSHHLNRTLWPGQS